MSYTTDNSGSLIPVARDYRYYPYAESPAAETSQSYLNRGVRPHSVIIAAEITKISFAFAPGTDGTAPGAGGWIDFGPITGSIQLDIHPIAWKKTHGIDPTVTFIYKGEV